MDLTENREVDVDLWQRLFLGMPAFLALFPHVDEFGWEGLVFPERIEKI